ncbi:aspartyl-phosphate phosphatase Spo0E family protein [Anaerobacillus alkalidiazotrophicus]|nr:aspartyl-phosphate phosphatase Spo0E family protein [Anaerobacillus alkalidiazotrophicus]
MKINSLRALMVSTAQLKGVTHPDTIKSSQELDVCLNEYLKISIPYIPS